MLLWAVPAGLAIGLSLGALGGGGSILTVPALVYVMHQDAHAATAGSLIVVGISAAVAAWSHWRAGRVRVRAGALFGLVGVAGSYAGSRASTAVDERALLAGFAVLMLLAAAAMLRRGRRGPTSSGGAGVSALVAGWQGAGKLVVTATAVGLLTGFFGVGGGFVVVPALVLTLGFTMPVAVGTSLLVITVNSAAALLSRAGSLAVDWPVIAVLTIVAVAGTVLGRRIADRASERTLTVAFSALLVALAGYVLARSAQGLM